MPGAASSFNQLGAQPMALSQTQRDRESVRQNEMKFAPPVSMSSRGSSRPTSAANVGLGGVSSLTQGQAGIRQHQQHQTSTSASALTRPYAGAGQGGLAGESQIFDGSQVV